MKDGDVKSLELTASRYVAFFANKLKERMKMVNVFTAEKKKVENI